LKEPNKFPDLVVLPIKILTLFLTYQRQRQSATTLKLPTMFCSLSF